MSYIDPGEAVRRLMSNISDHEVDAPEAMRQVLTAAFDLNKTERETLALVKIPASIEWAKREKAITLLYTALCGGTLGALARSTSGTLVPLVGVEWKDAVLWRDIILGGIIRASIGHGWAAYEGCAVLLETSTFEAWHKQRLRSVPAAPPSDPQNDACQTWLESEMRNSPDRRPRKKRVYATDAQARFGVSPRRFNDVIWPNAIASTGAKAWRKPGPQ